MGYSGKSTIEGYATGNVNGTINVGGFVGYISEGTVRAYALGYVSGTSDISSGVGSGTFSTEGIYTGHTNSEATAEGNAAGTGDHVGNISATATTTKRTNNAPTRWIIEEPKTTGTTANTTSKFYSKNQASFELTGKALSFSATDWDFSIDSSKQWPVLNLPEKIGTTEYLFSAGHTQDPKIPAKPSNFQE